MIPKVIYQTFSLKYEDLPDYGKNLMKTWIDMNPGWTHVYVNHEERRQYVEKYMPKILEFYDLLPNMYKADVWRYILLFNNGGVYVDLDSICLSPLDDIIELTTNQELICSPIQTHFDKQTGKSIDWVMNGMFGAIKNSNILGNIVNGLKTASEVWHSDCDEKIKYKAIYSALSTNVFYELIIQNKEKVSFKFESDKIFSHSDDYKFWHKGTSADSSLWAKVIQHGV